MKKLFVRCIFTFTLLLLTFVSATGARAADSGEFLWGVETHFRRLDWGPKYGVPGRSDSYSALMRQIEDLGVNLIRDGSMFDVLMPNAGSSRFETLDRLLADLSSRGITLDHVVTTTPAWAIDRNFDHSVVWRTPPTKKAWSALVQRLSQRYARYGRLYLLEVYNEPNLPIFWTGSSQKYFEILQVPAPSLYKVNGGLVLNQDAVPYIRGISNMLQNNSLAYFAFHGHDPLEGLISLYRTFVEGKIDPARIILNECGSSSLNDETQARELCAKALWAFAQGFRGFSAYYLGCVSQAGNQDLNEGRRDKDYSLVGDDMMPRPGYYAYKTVISMLRGAKVVKRVHDENGRHEYVFGKGQGLIYTAVGGRPDLELVARYLGDSYLTFDMYGIENGPARHIMYYVAGDVGEND
jgi:hypothetical protein